MSDIKYVKLTWDMIDIHCDYIARAIVESKKIPDIIIAVGRGGMIPARILADRLSISCIHLYGIKLYTGVHQRAMKPSAENFNHYIEKKNILLVDDILDSGITIEA